jgi:GxxExxY protein
MGGSANVKRCIYMQKANSGQLVAINPAVNDITRSVIGCAYTVSNSLGCGFLEKVYENAMTHELVKHGLKVDRQHTIKVHYDGVVVGDYIADLIVEDQVLVEIKNIDHLGNTQVAQCLNYLKATGIHIGLLMNFGTIRVEIKRLIL